jgi:Xaa-Pro aminopeptidase
LPALRTDITARVPYAWEDREPLLELDVPVSEFERRIAGIQEGMAREGIDAVLVHGGGGAESHLRYVTGFLSWWGETIAAIPRNGQPIFLTNSIFHGEPMHSNVQTTWLRDIRPAMNRQSAANAVSIIDLSRQALDEWGVSTGKIGVVDMRDLPHRIYTELQSAFPAAELVDAAPLVFAMRRIKSPAEIAVIRKLAHATSAGMDAAMAASKAGAFETDVAAAGCAEAIRAGAERMIYGVLTAAGKRGFMKNIYPLPGKRIEPDELVVIDLGAVLGGFRSDMSRNVVAGTPSDEVRRMLDACVEAQEAGLRATKPGATIGSILETMQAVIAGHGFAEWDWTTAHGFGLDILEEPYFHPGSQKRLEPGMCFYIEPMIVPTEIGTICFEDMVLVTEDGCEQLTVSPKRVW